MFSTIKIREPFQYANVGIHLSIQGSSIHYCSPRLDLEDIAEYSHVEVAITDLATEVFVHPCDSRINLPELDKYFNQVGAYVPYEDAMRIKSQLDATITIPVSVVHEITV